MKGKLLYLLACIGVGVVTAFCDVYPSNWQYWALMACCIAAYFGGNMNAEG